MFSVLGRGCLLAQAESRPKSGSWRRERNLTSWVNKHFVLMDQRGATFQLIFYEGKDENPEGLCLAWP